MSLKFRTYLAATILVGIFSFANSLASGTSNLFLPGHVVAEKGEITLYADYGSVGTDGRVPVYLVNRTSEALTINVQDGDIYLKLQYQESDGSWVRAQPHRYSWCGNSYYEHTVPADQYILISGYQPINGIPKTIRYELYSQSFGISSNSGFGVVAEKDINQASGDALSIRAGSFEYVSGVALSLEPVVNDLDHITDLRDSAIWELSTGRLDKDLSRKVLLQVIETSPEMAQLAEGALKRLDQRTED